MKPKTIALATITVFLVAASTLPASAQSWLHVRVESEDSEKISVNVPMSLVSTVLPLLEDKVLPHRGHGIHFDDKDLSIAELRKIWEAVKAEESGEIVNVETKESRIRVFTDRSYLRVESDEASKSKVSVRIPVPVVDALLSGEGEELNVVAALEALQELGGTELVAVEADEANVRIWIDEMSSGQ